MIYCNKKKQNPKKNTKAKQNKKLFFFLLFLFFFFFPQYTVELVKCDYFFILLTNQSKNCFLWKMLGSFSAIYFNLFPEFQK